MTDDLAPAPPFPSLDLMTIEEVAEYLRVPLGTVRWWRANKTGPVAARLGGRIMYRRTDVDAWVDEQFAKAADDLPTAAGA